MKKVILGIIALIVIAVAYFAVQLFGNLDSIIKAQIEKQGSHYLQTDVKVDSVTLKIFDGLGQIKGLSIANPEGFNQPTAMAFGEFKLDIQTKDITSSPFVIQELLISAPEVTYEVDAQGNGNLQALLENLEKQLPASDDQPAEQQPEQSASGESPLVAINKVTVSEVKFTLDLEAMGFGTHDMTLPTFQADPVGVPNGVPADQAGSLIAKSMLSNLIKAAKKQQEEKLKGKLEEKAKSKLSDLLNKN